jgi:hypothetical protein
MIIRQKEPLSDADLTRPRTRFPIPFSTHRTGTRTLSLVLADAQGDPGADHRLAYLESVARHRNAVRGEHRAVVLLHLHGLGEAALGRCVGGPCGGRSSAPWSPVGCCWRSTIRSTRRRAGRSSPVSARSIMPPKATRAAERGRRPSSPWGCSNRSTGVGAVSRWPSGSTCAATR